MSATMISAILLSLVTDAVTGDCGGVCCAALAIRTTRPAAGPGAALRGRNPQHIAHAADGVNQARLGLVDLAPQVN
jgi:hypothetical protein